MFENNAVACAWALSSMLQRFALRSAVMLCLACTPVHAELDRTGTDTRQLIIQLQDIGIRKTASVKPDDSVPGLVLPDGRHLSYVRSLNGDSIVVQLPEAVSLEEADALIEALMLEPSVQDVQIDKRMYPAVVPNDTDYFRQWHLFQDPAGMRAHSAWDTTTGSSSVVIAVLDTGILNHADLAASRVLSGYDFITDDFTANDSISGRDTDPTDPGDAVVANECPPPNAGNQAQPSSWHGLSVTGVMAATSNNGTGIAGIDFAARILPVRVLGKCGGDVSDIVDAIRWAAGLPVTGAPVNTNPAGVINLSLAGPGACSTQEQSAINDAVAAGSVVVVAAGNEGGDVAGFSPANCANVITVGAIARDGSITTYTNRGEEVDLTAPGGEGPAANGSDNLLTLWNNGTTTAGGDEFAFITGTSFTTAEVSAVVALMLAVDGTLEPSIVKGILRATTRAFPDGSCTTSLCGTGLLDASAALAGAADPQSVGDGGGSSIGGDPGGGGGGGGCSMMLVANPIDPMLPFWLLAAFIGMYRRSR